MANRARLTENAPLRLLAVVAVGELVINRLAVPSLRPVQQLGEVAPPVPGWHTALDFAGLFLFYFLATLAVLSLGVVVHAAVRAWRAGSPSGDGDGAPRLGLTIAATVPVALLVAGSLLGGTLGASATMALELALAAVVIASLVRALRRGADISVAIGLVLLCLPLLLHAYGVIAARWIWIDGGQGGEAIDLQRMGLATMCLVALASPYTLGPRPLARALTKLVPIGVALLVSASLLVLLRVRYDVIVDLANRALGLTLRRDLPDPRMAMFVLALATLAWTLVSCGVAEPPARRRLGVAVVLIVTCGGALAWPGYFAVVAVGVIAVADQVSQLGRLAAVKSLTPVAPAIDDDVWQGYVTQLVTAMRARGHQAQALTTRGQGDDTGTVLAGEIDGRAFQVRVQRAAGSVTVIDTRFGRDVLSEARPPTFTVVARRGELLGEAHIEPATVPGPFKLSEPTFDERFRSRGDEAALRAVLDDNARQRAVLTLEGWLGVWQGVAVRSVVQPGRGASLDQPMPLAELAGRGQAPDAPARMIAALELLATMASRVVPAVAPAAPASDIAASEPSPAASFAPPAPSDGDA